jgi:hypothetical protein
MWHLDNPILNPIAFDFTSSDQGHYKAHQILIGDVELVNIQELVETEKEPYQLLICEQCGITNCQPGGWVQLRKSDSIVMLTPAYHVIEEEHELNEEYYPPTYLREKGVAYIESVHYDRWRETTKIFPSIDNIPVISTWESVKVFQGEAPLRMLGIFDSQPVLRKDMIIASSSGNYLEQIEFINDLLAQDLSQQDITIAPIRPDEKIVTLYIDVPACTEWKALVAQNDVYSLYLEPGFKIHFSNNSFERTR